MKSSFTLMMTILACVLNCFGKVHAQNYCNTPRFDTTDVFKGSEIENRTLVYGYNKDWQGKKDTLELRLYYPNNAKDTFKKRPLIVMLHGGGFVRGDLKSARKKQIYFAQKGFVTASINYRLGWDQECVAGNDTSFAYAIYRAVQDLNAALRFLAHNAAAYKIDAKKILLLGVSAGAITCLTGAFVNRKEFDRRFPGTGHKLGGLNNETNPLRDDFSVLAMITRSGAIFDTSLINTPEAIPLLLIHGTSDHVVPFISGNIYNCAYYPHLHGSSLIQQRLDNLGECYELDYQVDGGHGSVYKTEDSFVDTRESHFFKRVLCKDCRQIIYKDQQLTQDNKISNNIISDTRAENSSASILNAIVYPNPASDDFKLLLKTNSNAPVTIEVTDIYGRKLYGVTGSANNVYTFGRNFVAGIYFVRIMQGNNTQTIKLIKQ